MKPKQETESVKPFSCIANVPRPVLTERQAIWGRSCGEAVDGTSRNLDDDEEIGNIKTMQKLLLSDRTEQ